MFLSGHRGIPVAQALAGAGHHISRAVIPSTSKSNTLANACKDLGVEVMPIYDVNADACIASLAALEPSLLVVAGYPSIFGDSLLNVAKHGAINLHGGRLPKYRGGSPLNWQILNGEPVAGISVIRLDEGIDTGNVLAETNITIEPDDTISDLHTRANLLFPKLTVQVIKKLEKGPIRGRAQTEAEACYWHQRSDDDGHISLGALSAAQAHNFVRALTRPYPGAFAYHRGSRIRIFKSAIPEVTIRGTAGRVCYIQKTGPYVICRDRAILLHEYIFETDQTERLRHGAYLE